MDMGGVESPLNTTKHKRSGKDNINFGIHCIIFGGILYSTTITGPVSNLNYTTVNF